MLFLLILLMVGTNPTDNHTDRLNALEQDIIDVPEVHGFSCIGIVIFRSKLTCHFGRTFGNVSTVTSL